MNLDIIEFVTKLIFDYNTLDWITLLILNWLEAVN